MNKPTNISELISYLKTNPRVELTQVVKDQSVISRQKRTFKEYNNGMIWWNIDGGLDAMTPTMKCNARCLGVELYFYNDGFDIFGVDDENDLIVVQNHFTFRD
jgi:hypothetical protein